MTRDTSLGAVVGKRSRHGNGALRRQRWRTSSRPQGLKMRCAFLRLLTRSNLMKERRHRLLNGSNQCQWGFNGSRTLSDSNSWLEAILEPSNHGNQPSILSQQRKDWSQALSNAERIAGYPTSFLSLKFLLKDEISNLAFQMRRLMATRHPVIYTAKNILSNNQQVRGLVVLLTAKAIGVPVEAVDMEEGRRISQIAKDQRLLAEITDMINVAQMVHNGVLNLTTAPLTESNSVSSFADLNLGNKIAILVGDYLLATASRRLAELRNPTIVSWMSQAIGDFTEGEFLKYEKAESNPEEGEEQRASIEKQCFLSGGSLLGYGCKSTALVAGYRLSSGEPGTVQLTDSESGGAEIGEKEEMVEKAFSIGRHIGIALQLQELMVSKAAPCEGPREVTNRGKTESFLKRLLELHVKKSLHLIDLLHESDASQALRSLTLSLVEKDLRCSLLMENSNKNNSFSPL